MELLQLKYFCDAAETENFSKTAEKYRVPPSNISQSIKRLEMELSVPLFIRSANKIVLSEQGKLFYSEIKKALHIIGKAKNAVSFEDNKGTIKINIHINRRIVMQAVEKFRKLFPEINIIVEFGTASESTDFDIIVTNQLLNNQNFEKIKTGSEEILIAYEKNFLPQTDKLSPNDIKDKPFIAMSKGNSHYDLTHDICGDFGFSPRIAIQSDDPFYIRQCVELGLGISFVPELSWRGQFSDNVTLKRIGNYSRNIYIYKQKIGYSSKAMNKLIELIAEEFV